MPISFSNIGGAEPSTVTFRAGTVVIPRGTTNEQQELVCIGDPQTSNAIARVVAAPPVSTEFGTVVRIASGPSSASDLLTQISGNSTVLQGTSPWIIGGNSTVIVVSGNSSVIITSGNSSVIVTSGTLSATQGTSPWVVSEAMNSSVAPSSNSSGVIVRQVVDAILTTASSNAFTSSSFSIQSSGAAVRSYVVAYSITSTVQAPTKVAFYSSGTMTWPIVLGALSSAVTGANLAVSAPAYLFRTTASEALTLQVPSSVAGFKVGVSYFRAP